MLTRGATLISVVLLVSLLLPQNSSAKTQAVLGSLTITGAGPTDLVGVEVTHKPGFEKTSSQQLPPFTAPIFLDEDANDTNGDVLNSRFETTLMLTDQYRRPEDHRPDYPGSRREPVGADHRESGWPRDRPD